MSYLVLARKWRPQNFDDVVGQEAVVKTLQNGLARNRVAHAMLFSGVRGVGKTTLARIMAKALNCHQGPTPDPCNKCESCLEITAGSALDLHEIDGASNRGIQEIRELKENIRFYPAKDRYKIVIIDEVHMLTSEAFNALLKTLEEPPDHVFFIFATTELHKIPITILSRCQRYELKRISFGSLTAFFQKIAGNEGVQIAPAALEMIVREAEGSVRDGLSLLDQVFSFAGEKVTVEDVVKVLGLVDRQVIADLAGALLAGDFSLAMQVFDKTYSFGIDLKRFAHDLLRYFRAILVAGTSAHAELLADYPEQEQRELQELARGHQVLTVHNCFRLLMKGVEDMQYATLPRLTLESAFMAICQAGEILPVSELLNRLDTLLERYDHPAMEKKKPLNPVQAADRPTSELSGSRLAVAAMGASTATAVEESLTPRSLEASVSPQAMAPAVKDEPAAVDEIPPKASLEPSRPCAADSRPASKDIRRNWDKFLEYVKDRKPWMSHSLSLCSASREAAGDLILKFDQQTDSKMLRETENLKNLTEYAQDFFQAEFKVIIAVRGAGAEEQSQKEGLEAPLAERRALFNDPLVQIATEVLGGQIVGVRTGPRFR